MRRTIREKGTGGPFDTLEHDASTWQAVRATRAREAGWQ